MQPRECLGNFCDITKIPRVVAIGLYATLGGLLMTAGHELGHMLVASSMGCVSELKQLFFFEASTMVGACLSSDIILIALAGPFVSFILGLGIWLLAGEDNLIRLAALLSWVYGVIPNIAPWSASMNDINVAISNGLSPVLAWAIYAFYAVVIFGLIAEEIQDSHRKPI
jgi:hypothetical protein